MFSYREREILKTKVMNVKKNEWRRRTCGIFSWTFVVRLLCFCSVLARFSLRELLMANPSAIVLE
jgi:hypothetical protein